MTHGNALMTSSDAVLRVLRWLNGLYAACIAALLVASVVNGPWLFRALGVLGEGEDGVRRALALRLLVAVGIAGAVVAHAVLTHLLAMVATVRAGDPFIQDNARRLQAMAWWVLGGEGLHLLAGALMRYASTPLVPLDREWNFSGTPLLAVLMLFVLARVFEHGTRLRADLEGTV